MLITVTMFAFIALKLQQCTCTMLQKGFISLQYLHIEFSIPLLILFVLMAISAIVFFVIEQYCVHFHICFSILLLYVCKCYILFKNFHHFHRASFLHISVPFRRTTETSLEYSDGKGQQPVERLTALHCSTLVEQMHERIITIQYLWAMKQLFF